MKLIIYCFFAGIILNFFICFYYWFKIHKISKKYSILDETDYLSKIHRDIKEINNQLDLTVDRNINIVEDKIIILKRMIETANYQYNRLKDLKEELELYMEDDTEK